MLTSHQSDLPQTHLRLHDDNISHRNTLAPSSSSEAARPRCVLLRLFLKPRSLLTLAWAHIHRRSLALGSPETLTHGESSHSSVFIGLRQQDLHQTRTCPRWRPRCLASRCRTGSQPRGATPKASKTKSSARRMSSQTPPVRSRDLISYPESRVFSISGFRLTIDL